MKIILLLDDDRALYGLMKTALLARSTDVFDERRENGPAQARESVTVDLFVLTERASGQRETEFDNPTPQCGTRTRIVFLSAFFPELRESTQLTRELDISIVVHPRIPPSVFSTKVGEFLSVSPIPSKNGPKSSRVSSKLAIELARLTRAFADKLPEKLEQLGQAIDGAKLDRAKLVEARSLAHRLRGSAGSFGFEGVGELVGRVEDVLSAELASGSGEPQFWEQVGWALRDARRAAANAIDVPGEPEVPSEPPTTSVLVVNNDSDFLQLIKALCRKFLIQVIDTQSAEEAVEKARTESFVAAILNTDIDFKDSDICLLAQRIRESDRNASTPIAFTSTNGLLALKLEATEAARELYFDQPISDEHFGKLMEQLLSLQRDGKGRAE